MFGLKKSPLHRNARNHSVNPGFNGYSSLNPFDSDNESDNKQTIKPARRTSSEPSLITPHLSTNPFDDDDDIKRTHSSAYSAASTERNRYKNDFRDSGGFENQTVQELENYAVHKAEETTKTVNNCLRIAEDIRQDATKTVIALHQQGEQITRSHLTAADIEHDLSRVWFLSLAFCSLQKKNLLWISITRYIIIDYQYPSDILAFANFHSSVISLNSS